MALLTVTSPHASATRSTDGIMREVMLATIPGVVALTWFFGWGTLINIVVACFFALVAEALVLRIRNRPIMFYLKDGSALVTAVLLAIALPPYSPWWLVFVGTSSAIIVAKHLYGGMGYNPFNPAMVGYALLLISCPVEMTRWAAPLGAVDGQGLLSLEQALRNNLLLSNDVDGFTMATPLDLYKLTPGIVTTDYPQFSQWAGLGWEWVNLGFLAGGLWLLYRRVFSWHAPISMLAMLAILSAFFHYVIPIEAAAPPLLHLLSGATMLGAFFIVTDPVTSTVSVKGRLIYGAAIGLILYVIRVWGTYPDAIAFAVLLMNFAAPFIDHFTQPRVYGHKNAQGGIK